MLAVNDTNFRDNMEAHMDGVTEESYNNLMENAYLMGTKANFDWLMELKAQLDKGTFAAHDLAGVSGNEKILTDHE